MNTFQSALSFDYSSQQRVLFDDGVCATHRKAVQWLRTRKDAKARADAKSAALNDVALYSPEYFQYWLSFYFGQRAELHKVETRPGSGLNTVTLHYDLLGRSGASVDDLIHTGVWRVEGRLVGVTAPPIDNNIAARVDWSCAPLYVTASSEREAKDKAVAEWRDCASRDFVATKVYELNELQVEEAMQVEVFL